MATASERYLTLKDVKAKTGLGTSTIYRYMESRGFPKQIKLGEAVRWVESEIDAWARKQNAGHFGV